MDISLFTKDETRHLLQGLHGLEKESLRVTPTGELALTPHPKGLGSPLTNPTVTTDFSESQLEMITPPFATIEGALQSLDEIHREVYKNLENAEMIWPMSMPAVLPDTSMIPIARYGDSPEAKTRELYREGLAARYGKTMQMISGVHYNFSFDPAMWATLGMSKEDGYMHVIRNFLRYRWLLVYLFAASPQKHASYRCAMMHADDSQAISLRLSRCGYSNPAKLNISFNDFRQHLADIRKATETQYGPYQALSPQLNDHLLQIANEYYAPIRVKPPSLKGGLLESLETQGAGYLEIRILDISPFSPVGVDPKQLEFIHLFLTFCLFEDSPDLSPEDAIKANDLQQQVAVTGRHLAEDLRAEGESLLHRMRPAAQILGRQEMLEHLIMEVKNPSDRIWHRMLSEEAAKGEDFLQFGLRKAREHADHFRS